MLHTPPLSHHCPINHYATSLQMYALKHYKAGCIEVHIIFDDLGHFDISPKALEHQRHYSNTAEVKDHNRYHHEFNPNLYVREWGNILKCQSCKRNLTTALANAMLQTAAVIMLQNCRLIVAGGFTESNRDKAYMVTKSDDTLLPIEALDTNMEEGDMRVWIHCKHSAGTRKLIFSPDTDTYHIGIAW